MKPRIYVETSIPSFYHETRTEPEMVAKRIWTRQWWDGRRVEYEVVTSEAVLDELSGGDYPTRDQALSLVSSLPVLPVEPPIAETVEVYIAHQVMPQDPLGDALHLALASYHRCDFLLTWNCMHIANAAVREKIEAVCRTAGFQSPVNCTPLELLVEEDQ